jgi:flagellar biosynthesis protein FliR
VSITLPAGIALPTAAGRELVAFVLVIGRIGPLFVLAPVLSAPFLPRRAKFVGAAAFALALTPIAAAGQTVPTDPFAFAMTLGKEIIVGLAFALAIAIATAAVQAGSSLVDTTVGFSFGAVIDPLTGNNSAVLGQVYGIFATMVFLLSGGVRLTILGLARSYSLVPLGRVPSIGSLAALALHGLEQVPIIGFELCAPVLLSVTVTDATFGLLARAVPQMNVLVVALPLKVLLAFAVVAVSLPLVGLHLVDDFQHGVSTALTAFAH